MGCCPGVGKNRSPGPVADGRRHWQHIDAAADLSGSAAPDHRKRMGRWRLRRSDTSGGLHNPPSDGEGSAAAVVSSAKREGARAHRRLCEVKERGAMGSGAERPDGEWR
jgi:hypothetical protein